MASGLGLSAVPPSTSHYNNAIVCDTSVMQAATYKKRLDEVLQ